MIESHVMGQNIVCDLQTCQPFATCKETVRKYHSQISTMDTDLDVARRLIALREHHKRKQSEFADDLGVGKSVLSSIENGRRRLPIEIAKQIHRRYGVSLDWLLFGNIGQPSHDLAVKLGPAPKLESDMKKRIIRKKRSRAA